MSQRELVKSVYPSKTWAAKVDKMSDAQVHAVFLKFKQTGKL